MKIKANVANVYFRKQVIFKRFFFQYQKKCIAKETYFVIVNDFHSDVFILYFLYFKNVKFKLSCKSMIGRTKQPVL